MRFEFIHKLPTGVAAGIARQEIFQFVKLQESSAAKCHEKENSYGRVT